MRGTRDTRDTLAVIVPFRDRDEHLRRFIPFMGEFLKGIDYEMVIVEQERGKPFNRGKLLNIGTLEARASSSYCFHDVDMLPTVADYTPVSTPTHLATRVEQFSYKLPYQGYFGGVTIFDRGSFIKVNGYSNSYWGWGAEDDDILFRCLASGIRPVRRDGRYESLPHDKAPDDNSRNFKKYAEFKKSDAPLERMREDGLSTLDYEVVSRVAHENNRVKHVQVRI
jgi:hypothetical protein